MVIFSFAHSVIVCIRYCKAVLAGNGSPQGKSFHQYKSKGF